MLLNNGTVFNGAYFENGLQVRLSGGIVSETGRNLHAQPGEEVIDLKGDYLLPGFVDVHIHGCFGQDTMRGEEAVRCMSRCLYQQGVAAFCPTTMSAGEQETISAVRGIRAVMNHPEKNGARVIGAHLEAPFLQPERAGAQKAEYFRAPDYNWLLRITEGDLSVIRLITLAPELPNSETFVRRARENNIRISIGHSSADSETVHQCAAWGADHVTHLFNAQTPLHHRLPGIPGAALADERLYCEIICDGKHLHWDIVRMVIRCKGAAKTIAVTDAMEAAGMPDGPYELGGQKVVVSNGTARLVNGTIAGSVLTMPMILDNLIHRAGIEPESACTVCTSSPAVSVGEPLLGRIAAGSPAPLTRWKSDLRMRNPMGKVAFSVIR